VILKLAIKLLDVKHRLINGAKEFVTRKEEGASAVEYGLLVALIAAVIVAAVKLVGSKVSTGFADTDAALP
jgi:pilus assembly protein Flp/PilA